jgi:hypothetical protein
VVRSEPFVAHASARWTAALAGLLGLFAIGALQTAFQRGKLGPVAVASSGHATSPCALGGVQQGTRGGRVPPLRSQWRSSPPVGEPFSVRCIHA